jgi:RNA polymerase sigma factor (sigma-70 family)
MLVASIDQVPTAQSSMPPDPDVAALTSWVERGERSALEMIFARHAETALRLALRRTGNMSDAEDAVQDAFLSAMRGARGFRPERGTVRGWLLAAVHNACARQKRSAVSRRSREVTAASTPMSLPDVDLPEQISHLLTELPEHQRWPVELRYLIGLEYAEIAVTLGRKERTIRGQVDRGLSALRAIYARSGSSATPAMIAGVLAMLPSTTITADAVRRCTELAKSGPMSGAAASLPIWLWIAGGILAVGGGVGWIWQHGTNLLVSDPSAVAADPPPVLAVNDGTWILAAIDAKPYAGFTTDGRKLLTRTRSGTHAFDLHTRTSEKLVPPEAENSISMPLGAYPDLLHSIWADHTDGSGPSSARLFTNWGRKPELGPGGGDGFVIRSIWPSTVRIAALRVVWPNDRTSGLVALIERNFGTLSVIDLADRGTIKPKSGTDSVRRTGTPTTTFLERERWCWVDDVLVVIEPDIPTKARIVWIDGVDVGSIPDGDLSTNILGRPTLRIPIWAVGSPRSERKAPGIIVNLGNEVVSCGFEFDGIGKIIGWQKPRTVCQLNANQQAIYNHQWNCVTVIEEESMGSWKSWSHTTEPNVKEALAISRLTGIPPLAERLAAALPVPTGARTQLSLHPLAANGEWNAAFLDHWYQDGTQKHHVGLPITWDAQGNVHVAADTSIWQWTSHQESELSGNEEHGLRILVHPMGTVAAYIRDNMGKKEDGVNIRTGRWWTVCPPEAVRTP